MALDLTLTNSAGLSPQMVLDVLCGGLEYTKKEIQDKLGSSSNIDALLKKLEQNNLISKSKQGKQVFFCLVPVVEVEPPPVVKKTQKKLNKASPKAEKTPAEIAEINKQTENIVKDHQITSLVEVENVNTRKSNATPNTREVTEADLDILKQELSGRLGKEVTAVLHKRNDRAVKDRKQTATEIFEKQQKDLKKDAVDYEHDNPFKFVLNFFTTTLNAEKATPYFRRRDEYAVKSIYNKFKMMCDKVDDYSISPQNLPFYRAITINETDKTVKIYHIDMGRVIRGVHTLFKLDDTSIKYLFG